MKEKTHKLDFKGIFVLKININKSQELSKTFKRLSKLSKFQY